MNTADVVRGLAVEPLDIDDSDIIETVCVLVLTVAENGQQVLHVTAPANLGWITQVGMFDAARAIGHDMIRKDGHDSHD